MKRKKLIKKLEFFGKAKEFLHSDAEITVLIASRGFGKSVVASYLAAKKMANGESGILMAPTYKDVIGGLLRNVVKIFEQQGYVEGKHFIINNKVNELYLLDQHGEVKSFCVFRSADNPECARGVTDVSWFVMDEAALCKKMAFDATIPVLRGEGITDTQIYLITSPRGIGNWVSELFFDGATESIQASVYDCTWMTDEQREKFIAKNKKLYSDAFFRQEILGEIIDINADSVFSSGEIDDLFTAHTLIDGDVIAGLDIGRKGDPTVIAIKRGNRVEHIEQKYNLLTLDAMKSWLVGVIAKYPQLKRIYIDETGLGQYIPSELSKTFPKIESIGLNFGAKSTKEGYHLIRSEIFFDLKTDIQNGLHISPFIDNDLLREVKRELCSIEYKIGDKSEMYVLSKDKTKEILGRSPDCADALALMSHKSNKLSNETITSAMKQLAQPKRYYSNKQG